MSRGISSVASHRWSRVAFAGVSLLAMSVASAVGQEQQPNGQTGSRTRNGNASDGNATALETIVVTGQSNKGTAPTSTIGQPPAPYAGDQVATGARIGMLGNRPVLQTPFSITALTSKLIRDQQAQSVADVTLNDPSVRQDAPAFSERDSFAAFRLPISTRFMTAFPISPIRGAVFSKASSGSKS